jgi:hypothetical protein
LMLITCQLSPLYHHNIMAPGWMWSVYPNPNFPSRILAPTVICCVVCECLLNLSSTGHMLKPITDPTAVLIIQTVTSYLQDNHHSP